MDGILRVFRSADNLYLGPNGRTSAAVPGWCSSLKVNPIKYLRSLSGCQWGSSPPGDTQGGMSSAGVVLRGVIYVSK